MADTLKMLALSPTMEQGTIQNWKISEGDSFRAGEVICEVETDKAVMEYESSDEGVLLKILVPSGGAAGVGDPIGVFGGKGEDISGLLEDVEKEREAPNDDGAGSPAPKPASGDGPEIKGASAREPGPSAGGEGRVKASPLARKIARSRGIDLHALKGSGPGGRIVKKDVESAPGVTSFSPDTGDGRDVPVSSRRKVIAERLAESANTAPHFYLEVAVDAGALAGFRREWNTKNPKRRISLNAFLMKFAAEVLKRHPRVNASWRQDRIREHASQDIGLAVALDDGLVAPVVRRCGEKGVEAIDRELSGLVQKARAGRLAPEDYSGATFTVSNLGSYGIDAFTAVINPPASAILAVGRIEEKPVVREGQVAVGEMMNLVLSCDHRVIDGAVGALFLGDLRKEIEYPMFSLL
jgi:pyruvate dehydrogenase E2 component (dihydrolipoamide acetyltransferase)